MPEDREVRLEGPSLWIAGGVLAAFVAGAFWLGRATAPTSAGAPAGPGPLDAVEGPAVDANDKANFFDTVGAQGKAEPGREARQGAPAVPPVTPGSWFVQVFAGRDREAAEVVVGELRAKGWPVKVETQREGSGSLYRVRVGGYPTREAADDAVKRLRAEGRTGAWATHAGP